EVLREDEHLTAEDRAVAGHDGVAVRASLEHSEVRLAVANVPVELDERSGIEELDQALAGKQLSLLALPLDRLLAAGVLGLLAQLLEPVELRLRRVGAIVRRGHDGSLTTLSETRQTRRIESPRGARPFDDLALRGRRPR